MKLPRESNGCKDLYFYYWRRYVETKQNDACKQIEAIGVHWVNSHWDLESPIEFIGVRACGRDLQDLTANKTGSKCIGVGGVEAIFILHITQI